MHCASWSRFSMSGDTHKAQMPGSPGVHHAVSHRQPTEPGFPHHFSPNQVFMEQQEVQAPF